MGSAAGGLPPERRAALLHCVLSHHGADGNRSGPDGRGFGTPEALALYRLNALDAGVKGALEHGSLAGFLLGVGRGRTARMTSCAAITSARPAKVSSSARWGIVLEVTTPIATPIGESAPITSPSRTRTLPYPRCRQTADQRDRERWRAARSPRH